MEIKNTKKYDEFTTIIGNRRINQKKVAQMVKDVQSGLNLLPFCPIIVVRQDKPNKMGGNFGIIDGQHRFETSKQCEEPVYYLEHTNITLQQIAQLNSRGEKWKATDYLNCYINVGIEDYNFIKEIMETFKINIAVAISLLMHYDTTSRMPEDFQSGNFKCNHYEKTVELLTLVKDVFGEFEFCKDRNLIAAVIRIREKGLCNFETLKAKLKKAPHLIEKQLNPKSYIFYLEKVYNHNNQTRVVII